MNGPEFKCNATPTSTHPPANAPDAAAQNNAATPAPAKETSAKSARKFIDLPEATDAVDDPVIACASRILSCLGFCGHFMHFNRGGRSGRAPILCLLEKNGGTLSQQELGMFFELKPGSLSEILSKLETAGLIYRTRGQQDRRQLTVTLTEAGAEAARQEAEIRQRFRSNAFSTLTPEEQETLAGLLERVRAHWEGLDG